MSRNLVAWIVVFACACSTERVVLRVNLGISGDQTSDYAERVTSLKVILAAPGEEPEILQPLDARQTRVGVPGLRFRDRLDITVEGLTSGGISRYFGSFPGARIPVSGELSLTVFVRKRNDFAQSFGPAPTARRHHTATLLRDGRVLVVGGVDPTSGEALASAELFDPGTSRFTATGALLTARAEHAAALLADGRVVVAGGAGGAGLLRSIEIYDPVTGAFAGGGDLAFERAGLTLTPYQAGSEERLLAAGGRGAGGPRDSAEIYVPAQRGVAGTRTMAVPREGHAAVPVPTGILVVGGHPSSKGGEIFVSAAEQFGAAAPTMAAPRLRASAVTTDAGRILILGSGALVEAFLPGEGRFESVTSLSLARDVAVAAPIPGDGVLVAGGWEGAAATGAEVIEGTSRIDSDGPLDLPRGGHTLTALADGTVLVVGGTAGAAAEVFQKR